MVSRAAERFRATGLKRQEPPNLGLWCPTPYSLSDLAGGRRLTLPQPPQNMSPDLIPLLWIYGPNSPKQSEYQNKHKEQTPHI